MIAALDHSMDEMKADELWILLLQWGLVIGMLIVLIVSLASLFKLFLGGDSSKYEDLKYDLQQIMIFGDIYIEK